MDRRLSVRALDTTHGEHRTLGCGSNLDENAPLRMTACGGKTCFPDRDEVAHAVSPGEAMLLARQLNHRLLTNLPAGQQFDWIFTEYQVLWLKERFTLGPDLICQVDTLLRLEMVDVRRASTAQGRAEVSWGLTLNKVIMQEVSPKDLKSTRKRTLVQALLVEWSLLCYRHHGRDDTAIRTRMEELGQPNPRRLSTPARKELDGNEQRLCRSQNWRGTCGLCHSAEAVV